MVDLWNIDKEITNWETLLDIFLAVLQINDPELRQKIVETLNKYLGEIFREFEESRPPRISMIGRTRAGKTQLLRAIFDIDISEVGAVMSTTFEPKWWPLESDKGISAEILDTRGIQEGLPPEGAPAITSLASLLAAVKEKEPDIILFVTKASEVNAAIQGDLDGLNECLKTIFNKHNFYPLIMGTLTHCDQLAPP